MMISLRYIIIIIPITFLGFLVGPSCKNTPSDANDTADSTNTQVDYIKLGDSITYVAQVELINVLLKAMEANGTEGAVSFCNTNALGIMDILSEKFDCKISRISDKYRNPADKLQGATDNMAWQVLLKQGSDKKAFTMKKNDQTVFYTPIVIGANFCLKCHGDPQKDIEPGTLAKIKELYPGDLATGYKYGDLRGAWKVEFKK